MMRDRVQRRCNRFDDNVTIPRFGEAHANTDEKKKSAPTAIDGERWRKSSCLQNTLRLSSPLRSLSRSLSLSLKRNGNKWVSGEVWEDVDAREKKISMSCDRRYTEWMRAKTPDRKPNFDTKMHCQTRSNATDRPSTRI